MGVPALLTLSSSRSVETCISAFGSRYTRLSRSFSATSATVAAAGPATRASRASAKTAGTVSRVASRAHRPRARLPCAGRLVLIGILHDRDRAAVRLLLSRDSTTTVQHARVGVRHRQVPVPAARGVEAAYEPVVQGLAQREPGDQVGRRPPEVPAEPRLKMGRGVVEGHPAQAGADPADLRLDAAGDQAHAGLAGRHRTGRAG